MTSLARCASVFAVLSHSGLEMRCKVEHHVFIQTVAPHKNPPPLPAAIAVTTHDEAAQIIAIVRDFCERNKAISDGGQLHDAMLQSGVMTNLQAFFQGVVRFWVVLEGKTVALHIHEEEARYSLAQSKPRFRLAYLFDNISDSLLCLFTRGRLPTGKHLPWDSHLDPARGQQPPLRLSNSGEEIPQPFSPIKFPFPLILDVPPTPTAPSTPVRGQKRRASEVPLPSRSPTTRLQGSPQSPTGFRGLGASQASSSNLARLAEIERALSSHGTDRSAMVSDFLRMYHGEQAREIKGLLMASRDANEFQDLVRNKEWASLLTTEQVRWIWDLQSIVSD